MPNGPFSSKYAPSPSPKYAPGGRGLPTLCWIYSSLTKFDTLIRSIRDMQGQGLHHQLISCQSHFYAKPFHPPLCQFHLYEIYWPTLVCAFICTNIHSDIAATSTYFSATYLAERRKEILLLLLCRFYIEVAERERESGVTPNPQYSTSPRTFSPSQEIFQLSPFLWGLWVMILFFPLELFSVI